jgi:hypothetical protein
MQRVLSLVLVAAALAMFLGTAVADQPRAGDRQQVAGDIHEGKFVSMSGNQFTMSDDKGVQHKHTLAANGKVTLDGKDSSLQDLKAGMRIKVTTAPNDLKTATRIDAQR